MAVDMQQRRDIKANWESKNPIIPSGQICYETDTQPWKEKVGDGINHWMDLPYSTTSSIIDIPDADFLNKGVQSGLASKDLSNVLGSDVRDKLASLVSSSRLTKDSIQGVSKNNYLSFTSGTQIPTNENVVFYDGTIPEGESFYTQPLPRLLESHSLVIYVNVNAPKEKYIIFDPFDQGTVDGEEYVEIFGGEQAILFGTDTEWKYYPINTSTTKGITVQATPSDFLNVTDLEFVGKMVSKDQITGTVTVSDGNTDVITVIKTANLALSTTAQMIGFDAIVHSEGITNAGGIITIDKTGLYYGMLKMYVNQNSNPDVWIWAERSADGTTWETFNGLATKLRVNTDSEMFVFLNGTMDLIAGEKIRIMTAIVGAGSASLETQTATIGTTALTQFPAIISIIKI